MDPGNAAKLDDYLSDPAERLVTTHDDEHWTDDYFRVHAYPVTDFDVLRQARITDTGITAVVSLDQEQTRYQTMTHDDPVERVHELEHRATDLGVAFEVFPQRVLEKLG